MTHSRLVVVVVTAWAFAAIAQGVTLAAADSAPHHGAFASVHPTVTPPVAGRRTVFKIRFTSHAILGRRGNAFWDYELIAHRRGGYAPAGCSGGFTDYVQRGRPGQRLAFVESWKLTPTLFSTGWCVGRYHGTIRLIHRRACIRFPAPVCRVVVARRVVGRVSWVVQSHK